MLKKNTTTLVITALLTALVLICTLLLRIPCGPDCYIHLGDAVILLAVMILPRKYACFAGAVGATLADLMGGFAFWAPWTFCVKLLMVLTYGIFVDKAKALTSSREALSGKTDAAAGSNAETAAESVSKTTDGLATICGIPRIEFIGLVLACIVAVGGYFVSEMILFGQWLGALACVGFNTVQVVVDAIVAVLVSNSLYNSNMRNSVYYRRPMQHR